MKRLFALLLLSLGFLGSASAQGCDQFFVYGHPQVTDSRQTIDLCHIGFMTIYDPAHKVAVMSVEDLIPGNIDGTTDRTNNFGPDPQLQPGQRAELVDFQHLKGIVRGHLAPAEDMRANTALMMQCFYLSNMVLQNGSMNSGIWRSLEMSVTKRVLAGERLHVYTGPIFEGEIQYFGPDHLPMPSALFKVIVNKERGTVEAYIIPNIKLVGHKYREFQVSLLEVQLRAHENMFPQSTVAVRDLIQATAH